jgi:CPA2 family monovalent cation:H+ antiporter-2
LSGLAVLAAILALLAVAFWRTAADLFGHFRAGAELVVSALAKQARAQPVPFEMIRQILPGLGDFTPVKVPEHSAAAGRSLGELNLRGRTGATVVALLRGSERVAFPEAEERLAAGDFVALTGSHEAIAAARDLLTGRAARKGAPGSGQAAQEARRAPQAER